MTVSRFFLFYNKAPFLRLLIPLIGGIIFQWHFPVHPFYHWIALLITGCFICLSLILKGFIQFRNRWLAGLFINLLMFYCGRLLLHYNNPGDNIQIQRSLFFVASIESPLVQKTKSRGAEARIRFLTDSSRCHTADEKINIYIGPGKEMADLGYGSQILFHKIPVPIEYSGKGQTFDYKKYAALRHIYRQVYLSPDDLIVLPGKSVDRCTQFIITIREKLISILRRYISGKEECSLLEALLIGYTGDLDRGVRQSYTNTGVVHIIAISGLHLALIYGILQFMFQQLQVNAVGKWVSILLLLCCLWLFSFIAGAGPSVLRSALMLTIALLGNHFMRPASVYNSLSLSAFLLLCYNPLWLWDIGFQLSYLAVLSLVVFRKPIAACIRVKNKLLQMVWNASAVSLSAQVLTTPVSIYYFHQFPNYFLITNLVAVPLSSALLAGGLLLCVFACFPPAATVAGFIVSKGIFSMNHFIEYMSRLPFAVWGQLDMSLPQLIVFYLFIITASIWVYNKD